MAVDDEAIASAGNLLLTFTNVRNEAGKGNDIFNRATETILDMSAALGQDTSSSAIQLGKALNDPIKGITALTRVGVTFTEQQKNQIRAMVEAGDTLGAQRVILAELNKEFAGSAEAAADPTARLAVAFGNLQESVGTALAPALGQIATGATSVAEVFSGLPAPIQTTIVGLTGLAAISPILIRVYDGLQRVSTQLRATAASGTLMGRSLTGLARIGGYAVGILAAAAAVGILVDALTKPVKRSVDETTRSLLDLGREGRLTGDIGRAFGDNWQHLGEQLDASNDSMLEGALNLGRTQGEITQANENVKALDSSLVQLFSRDPGQAAERFREVVAAAREQGKSFADVRDSLPGYRDAVIGAANDSRINADAIEESSAAAQAAVVPTQIFGGALDTTRITAGLTAGEIGRLKDKVGELQNELFAATDAQIAYEQSLDTLQGANLEVVTAQNAYNLAVRAFGAESTQAAAAAETLSDAQLSQRSSASGAAQAGLALQDSLLRQAEAFDVETRSSNALLAKIIDLKARYPELGAALDPFILRLNSLPEDKTVEVSAVINRPAFEAALSMMDLLERDRTVTFFASGARGDGFGVGASVGGLAPQGQRLVDFMRQSGVAHRVASGFRPGSRTRSGNQSYHALGRAIDFTGPNLMAIFRALLPIAGSLKELIYTPAGVGIRNGRPHRYTGGVAADHFDHVHVALAEGGIVRHRPGGVMANIGEGRYDEMVVPLDGKHGGPMNLTVYLGTTQITDLVRVELDGMAQAADDMFNMGVA